MGNTTKSCDGTCRCKCLCWLKAVICLAIVIGVAVAAYVIGRNIRRKAQIPVLLAASETDLDAGKLYSAMSNLSSACFLGALPEQTDGLKNKITEALSSQALSFAIAGQTIQMRYCPEGTFLMGSDKKEKVRQDDEVLHEVTITKPYWLSACEIDQALWNAVMESNNSHFKSDENPVEEINWNQAKEFCEKLNADASIVRPEGYHFSLPTEAQWEMACRAGSAAAYSGAILDDICWFADNGEYKSHPAGSKAPNLLGLHDMHGNVWEWCLDAYEEYPSTAVTDPLVQGEPNAKRVYRGGSWGYEAEFCRSASRAKNHTRNINHDLGFRLALIPDDISLK